MRKQVGQIAAAALVVMLAMPMAALAQQSTGASAPASSQPAAESSPVQVPQPQQGVNWPGAGYGAAALLGNVVYIPAKLVYAVLGGFIGGATWLVTAGNTQTANTVWRSALGGDYVLTPQMVAGEQPINFSGPTQTEPPPAPAVNSTGVAQTGSVAPIAPIPSTSGGSASAGSGSQPMDRGAGPVGGSGGHGTTLPDTSIE
jgi:hypothetical protein